MKVRAKLDCIMNSAVGIVVTAGTFALLTIFLTGGCDQRANTQKTIQKNDPPAKPQPKSAEYSSEVARDELRTIAESSKAQKRDLDPVEAETDKLQALLEELVE